MTTRYEEQPVTTRYEEQRLQERHDSVVHQLEQQQDSAE